MRVGFLLIILMGIWACPSIGLSADNAITGKIVMLKGVVNSSARPSSPLQKGDTIQEGDTITTGAGSLVKIEFSNNSTIFVGPESSMKLDKMENGKANVISLIKGQLQSRYSKGENSDYKAVVKTHTAALGVRGTHFLMAYNAENKVSSAVTFSGHVSFMKTPERWNDLCSKNPSKCGDLMVKGLDNNTLSRVISDGQLSQAFVNKKTATMPTQINRVQFFSLLENSPLQEETKSAKASGAIAKIEGDSGGPKAGGMLDLKTSLYVEPSGQAIQDPKTGHYLPLGDIGQVDIKTGEYKAPQGWELKPSGQFEMTKEKTPDRAADPNLFAKVRTGEGGTEKEEKAVKPPRPKIRPPEGALLPGCIPGLPCIPKAPGEDLINNGGLGTIMLPRARIKITVE
ncbi:MAG: FecR domain-containing protein [Bdellovibrio sp.]|nr:FecR domain-containing protein [Bdellovibrio sp.]